MGLKIWGHSRGERAPGEWPGPGQVHVLGSKQPLGAVSCGAGACPLAGMVGVSLGTLGRRSVGTDHSGTGHQPCTPWFGTLCRAHPRRRASGPRWLASDWAAELGRDGRSLPCHPPLAWAVQAARGQDSWGQRPEGQRGPASPTALPPRGQGPAAAGGSQLRFQCRTPPPDAAEMAVPSCRLLPASGAWGGGRCCRGLPHPGLECALGTHWGDSTWHEPTQAWSPMSLGRGLGQGAPVCTWGWMVEPLLTSLSFPVLMPTKWASVPSRWLEGSGAAQERPWLLSFTK